MTKPLEIYVIDDNKIDLFINQKVITTVRQDSKVVLFKYPEAALSFFRNHIELFVKTLNEVDRVLLVDINMPILNGFELLEELFKIPQVQKGIFHIYILSSSTSVADRNRASEMPLCAGYLTKPLTLESFSKSLNY